MLFERSLSIFIMTSLKHHIEYCTSISIVKFSWTTLNSLEILTFPAERKVLWHCLQLFLDHPHRGRVVHQTSRRDGLSEGVRNFEARAPQKCFVRGPQVVVLGQVVEVLKLQPRVVPPEAQVVVRLDLESSRVDVGKGIDANAEEDLGRGWERLFSRKCCIIFFSSIHTGWYNRILHRKLKYSRCFLTDVVD